MINVLLGALLVGPAAAESDEYPLWPDYKPLVAPTELGEYDSALVISIEDYLYLPDYRGAEVSADTWKKWLAESRGIPMERIQHLSETEATKENIEKALKSMGKVTPKRGTFWIIYIGHGGAYKGQALLIPSDMEPTKKGIKKGQFAWEELQKWLE